MQKIITAFIAFSIASAAFSQNGHSVIQNNKAFREKLNEEYRSDKSPLSKKDKEAFDGLPFYPIDTNFCVHARFERVKEVRHLKMKTSTSKKQDYDLYGRLYFKLSGKDFVLNVYQSHLLRVLPMYKDYLFLPFTDLTSGEETYGGGRYIDMRIPKDKKVTIDFNQAYNPYCAYSNGYSCPVPPKENFIDLRVTAGVKHTGH